MNFEVHRADRELVIRGRQIVNGDLQRVFAGRELGAQPQTAGDAQRFVLGQIQDLQRRWFPGINHSAIAIKKHVAAAKSSARSI